MIKIETLDEFVLHRYTVKTFCPKCGRGGPDLDLRKYIARGYGHLRPIDLRPRHASCQTVLQLTIHPEKERGSDGHPRGGSSVQRDPVAALHVAE